MEPRALQRALEDGTLLAERQVLRGERRAALGQQPEEDRDDLQCADRGSRVSGLPRAYRVASPGPAVGKRKQ
jgi:hypothetical protein